MEGVSEFDEGRYKSHQLLLFGRNDILKSLSQCLRSNISVSQRQMRPKDTLVEARRLKLVVDARFVGKDLDTNPARWSMVVVEIEGRNEPDEPEENQLEPALINT